MPFDWQEMPDGTTQLVAWPYRSLPRRGFQWFIGTTAVMLALPLIAVLGSVVLWGLLPFMALTVWGVWAALSRSYRTGETREVLTLTGADLHLRRSDPGRPDREWHANCHWVRAALRRGPVEDYLTLTDGRREVELGVFLTPEERRDLRDQLTRRLLDRR